MVDEKITKEITKSSGGGVTLRKIITQSTQYSRRTAAFYAVGMGGAALFNAYNSGVNGLHKFDSDENTRRSYYGSDKNIPINRRDAIAREISDDAGEIFWDSVFWPFGLGRSFAVYLVDVLNPSE